MGFLVTPPGNVATGMGSGGENDNRNIAAVAAIVDRRRPHQCGARHRYIAKSHHRLSDGDRLDRRRQGRRSDTAAGQGRGAGRAQAPAGGETLAGAIARPRRAAPRRARQAGGGGQGEGRGGRRQRSGRRPQPLCGSRGALQGRPPRLAEIRRADRRYAQRASPSSPRKSSRTRTPPASRTWRAPPRASRSAPARAATPSATVFSSAASMPATTSSSTASAIPR